MEAKEKEIVNELKILVNQLCKTVEQAKQLNLKVDLTLPSEYTVSPNQSLVKVYKDITA